MAALITAARLEITFLNGVGDNQLSGEYRSYVEEVRADSTVFDTLGPVGTELLHWGEGDYSFGPDTEENSSSHFKPPGPECRQNLPLLVYKGAVLDYDATWGETGVESGATVVFVAAVPTTVTFGENVVLEIVYTDRVYDHLEAAAAALGGPPLQMGERVGVHCSKIRPIGSEGVLFKVIWQGADAAIGPTFEELGMGDGWPMVFARWPADLDPYKKN